MKDKNSSGKELLTGGKYCFSGFWLLNPACPSLSFPLFLQLLGKQLHLPPNAAVPRHCLGYDPY
jgi:hypothetical protein